ncbi:hypothetical protein HDV05_007405, partial [Chytridiales sp. JEL 0842]
TINLRGQVRTYPFQKSTDFDASKAVVSVHWTPDNWKTTIDTPATPHPNNNTWSWDFSVFNFTSTSATDPSALVNLPENIKYAVQYKSASSAGPFWANNNGLDYLKTLKPILQSPEPSALSSKPLNGLISPYFGFSSDLELSTPYLKIDNEPFTNTTVVTINTLNLTEASHTLTVQSRLPATGAVIYTQTIPFTVKNTIRFKDQWVPALPKELDENPGYGSPASWSNVLDSKGRYWMSYDGKGQNFIARYSSYGTSDAPEAVFKIDVGGYITSLNVDDDGNVYAILSMGAMYKLTSTGQLDSTFGTQGKLDFHEINIDNTRICYPGYSKVFKNSIFISDTCNQRLVRLSTSTGKALSAYKFDINGITTAVSVSSDNQKLLLLVDPYDAPQSVASFEIKEETTELPQPTIVTFADEVVQSASGFIEKNNQLWIAHASALSVVDLSNGKVMGSWNGSGGQRIEGSDYYARVGVTPGRIGIAASVVGLTNGDVAVLGVEGGIIERFEGKIFA